jgi:hypothetical protein
VGWGAQGCDKETGEPLSHEHVRDVEGVCFGGGEQGAGCREGGVQGCMWWWWCAGERMGLVWFVWNVGMCVWGGRGGGLEAAASTMCVAGREGGGAVTAQRDRGLLVDSTNTTSL